MKNLIFSIFILLTICSVAFSQADETQRLREIREKSFKDVNLSPLLPEDFQTFKGLEYFPFDKNYRLTAKLVKSAYDKIFLIPTSRGGSRKYLKIGNLSFQLNGKEYSVSAFSRESVEIKELFVPFKDLSNGEQTYSAGRYVYLRMPKDGESAVLDFNLAHNPSCAYGNESFACTLPPKENFLQVEINAGEKKFVSPSKKTTP